MANLRKRYMAGFYRTDSMEGKKQVSLRQKETPKGEVSKRASEQIKKKQQKEEEGGMKMKRQKKTAKSSENYIPPPSWSLYSGGMAAGRGRGEALQWTLDEAGYRPCSSSMAAREARHRRRWHSSGLLSGWSMRRL